MTEGTFATVQPSTWVGDASATPEPRADRMRKRGVRVLVGAAIATVATALAYELAVGLAPGVPTGSGLLRFDNSAQLNLLALVDLLSLGLMSVGVVMALVGAGLAWRTGRHQYLMHMGGSVAFVGALGQVSRLLLHLT